MALGGLINVVTKFKIKQNSCLEAVMLKLQGNEMDFEITYLTLGIMFAKKLVGLCHDIRRNVYGTIS